MRRETGLTLIELLSVNSFTGSGYGRAFYLIAPYLNPEDTTDAAYIRSTPTFNCPVHDDAIPKAQYGYGIMDGMRNSQGTGFKWPLGSAFDPKPYEVTFR